MDFFGDKASEESGGRSGSKNLENRKLKKKDKLVRENIKYKLASDSICRYRRNWFRAQSKRVQLKLLVQQGRSIFIS